MNDSPFNVLQQGAIALHEMVISYEQAGFSRQEAIHIMLTQMANSNRINAEIEAEDRRRAEDRKRAQE